MEDVVGTASNASVLPPTLPDELEQVVHAGQHIVHEDDRVEELSLGVSELLQRRQCSITDLGEVLDAVVERSTGAEGGADDDAEADGAAEGVEDAQESLGLVGGSVLVDRDEDVVVAEDSRNFEHVGEEVWDNVEGVVLHNEKVSLERRASEQPNRTKLMAKKYLCPS